MPSVNIYIEEKIYRHLTNQGRAATVAQKWLKERYEQEVRKE